MLWAELTAKQFEEGVRASGGVCLLPIGVIEKHGDHLPLSTDMITSTSVCKKAAELETAVVFPYYFFGQIAEAQHYPGTVAVSHRLLMENMLAVCDEISRNGLKKIIIVSGHGGNNFFLPFFAQEMPRLGRDYSVYVGSATRTTDVQRRKIAETAGTNDMGYHAGLTETSMIMHLRPELVHMDAQDPANAKDQHRLDTISNAGLFTGFNWYGSFPNHFAGDPSPATPELGEMIFDMVVENVVNAIRAVKADDVSGALVKEFTERAANPKA